MPAARSSRDVDRHQGRRTPTASLGRPVGVGFSAVPPMAFPLPPSRRKQPAQALSRSSLKARNALVLEHLPLADAIATATARRLFPLVEREDLIQVAREALVRSAPRCRAGEPAGPYLRRASPGPCSIACANESAWCACRAGCMSRATALRLTVLEGLSLRQAAERLEISCMSVSHREV